MPMEMDQASLAPVLCRCYEAITEAVNRDRSEGLLLGTRCHGWIVRDVLYHQLLDAKRALRARAEILERLRVNRVVPGTLELVAGERHSGELLVGDLDSGRVMPLVEFGLDLEALFRRGVRY